MVGEEAVLEEPSFLHTAAMQLVLGAIQINSHKSFAECCEDFQSVKQTECLQRAQNKVRGEFE